MLLKNAAECLLYKLIEKKRSTASCILEHSLQTEFLFVIIAFHFLILMEHNEKAPSLSLGQWSQLFMQEHSLL